MSSFSNALQNPVQSSQLSEMESLSYLHIGSGQEKMFTFTQTRQNESESLSRSTCSSICSSTSTFASTLSTVQESASFRNSSETSFETELFRNQDTRWNATNQRNRGWRRSTKCFARNDSNDSSYSARCALGSEAQIYCCDSGDSRQRSSSHRSLVSGFSTPNPANISQSEFSCDTDSVAPFDRMPFAPHVSDPDSFLALAEAARRVWAWPSLAAPFDTSRLSSPAPQLLPFTPPIAQLGGRTDAPGFPPPRAEPSHREHSDQCGTSASRNGPGLAAAVDVDGLEEYSVGPGRPFASWQQAEPDECLTDNLQQ